MNPEHTTPVKCGLCGEPLGINTMYPRGLCWQCFWATSLISNGMMFKENATKQELNNLYGCGGFVKEKEDGRTTDI